MSIFFKTFSFLYLALSLLAWNFLCSLLGSFFAPLFTLSLFFLISSWTFLYKSSTDLTPALVRVSFHLENYFLNFSSPSFFNLAMYLSTWTPKILSLWLLTSYLTFLSSSTLYPGNLLLLWGTYNPPSTAPFNKPKTLLPVVVLTKPISKLTEKGLLYSFGLSLTL